MTEFSFTMNNGSTISWNAPDPEMVVSGRYEFEESNCVYDEDVVAAIDKLLFPEYTSGN